MTATIKTMTKDAILNRLYELVGVCRQCKLKVCHHEGKKALPRMISATDVLRAINLDEKYVKEPAAAETKKSAPAITRTSASITVHRCR